jgi:HEAT repeat protein
LGDKELIVRRTASEALVEIVGPAVTVLIASLRGTNAYARREAARALGEIGDPDAIQPLAALLGDPEYLVRWTALNALKSVGIPEALGAIRQHREGVGDRE